MSLKILHVWDQAGVSGILAKFQRKLGHKAIVVKAEGYDIFNIDEYYGNLLLPTRKLEGGKAKKLLRKFHKITDSLRFYIQVSRLSRPFDIVHIHDAFITSYFMPFKKKVILWHGASVRKNWQGDIRGLIKKIHTKLFLLINSKKTFFVSTEELTKDAPNSIWIPNPVDTDLFRKQKNLPKDKALVFHHYYESSDHATFTAAQNNWNLTILDRSKQKHPISYETMPRFLSSFEIFIDQQSIPSLSKTALEALAVGLKVVRWDGKIVSGLPTEHDPKNVAKRWLNIYYHVLTKGGGDE